MVERVQRAGETEPLSLRLGRLGQLGQEVPHLFERGVQDHLAVAEQPDVRAGALQFRDRVARDEDRAPGRGEVGQARQELAAR